VRTYVQPLGYTPHILGTGLPSNPCVWQTLLHPIMRRWFTLLGLLRTSWRSSLGLNLMRLLLLVCVLLFSLYAFLKLYDRCWRSTRSGLAWDPANARCKRRTGSIAISSVAWSLELHSRTFVHLSCWHALDASSFLSRSRVCTFLHQILFINQPCSLAEPRGPSI